MRQILWAVPGTPLRPHIITSCYRSTVRSLCGTFAASTRAVKIVWKADPPRNGCKLCSRRKIEARWKRMVLIGRQLGIRHPPTPEAVKIETAEEIRELEVELNQLEAEELKTFGMIPTPPNNRVRVGMALKLAGMVGVSSLVLYLLQAIL